MSLLLLFNDQVAPTPGDVSVTASLETTTGVFANISARLMAGDTTRGKQRELDRYDAGRVTITLENSDRLFDPEYAAGTYYGNLLPNKRLPVTATYNGTTYPVIVGYVDRIRQVYPSPNTSVAVFEATDGFKPLSRAPLETSAFAQEVRADSPIRWWHLDEPSGSTTLFDALGGANLVVQGTPTFGATSLVARDTGGSALTIVAVGDGGLSAPVVSTLTTTVSAECVWASRGTLPSGRTLAAEVNDVVNRGWVLEVAGGLGLFGFELTVATDAGSLKISQGTVYAEAATAPHHVVGTWDGATMTLYVDGAVVATGALAGTMFAAGATTRSIIGGAGGGPIVNTGAQGTIDEVAVYSTALSAARVTAHYGTVATPWNGDLPGARATRVLNAAGWPALARNLDTGSSTLQSATLGTSALEHLQKVADSELGLLYITRDGMVRLEARSNLINQTSVATITDTQGSTPAITADEPYITDDLVRNVVTVSRLDGIAQTARDAASVTLNGPVGYTLDGLYNSSDDLSRHIAEYIVTEYKDAKQRVDQANIVPRGNPSVLFPIVLAPELSDQITVKQKPQDVGAETSRSCVLEGIAHRFGPKSWETTFNLSPAPGGTTGTGYWALGVAGHSELGQTTVLYV